MKRILACITVIGATFAVVVADDITIGDTEYKDVTVLNMKSYLLIIPKEGDSVKVSAPELSEDQRTKYGITAQAVERAEDADKIREKTIKDAKAKKKLDGATVFLTGWVHEVFRDGVVLRKVTSGKGKLVQFEYDNPSKAGARFGARWDGGEDSFRYAFLVCDKLGVVDGDLMQKVEAIEDGVFRHENGATMKRFLSRKHIDAKGENTKD